MDFMNNFNFNDSSLNQDTDKEYINAIKEAGEKIKTIIDDIYKSQFFTIGTTMTTYEKIAKVYDLPVDFANDFEKKSSNSSIDDSSFFTPDSLR